MTSRKNLVSILALVIFVVYVAVLSSVFSHQNIGITMGVFGIGLMMLLAIVFVVILAQRRLKNMST
jgi:carbon starvation protein CstA